MKLILSTFLIVSSFMMMVIGIAGIGMIIGVISPELWEFMFR